MKQSEIEFELNSLANNNYNLPQNIKPILQISSNAKLLIIGPAPGIRAHKTGTPWNDSSGVKLRSWLDISKEEFYNKNKVALLSMNFWYPGVDNHGHDNPPSLVHAELWHRPLLKLLRKVELTLLIGHQAQTYILKDQAKKSMTATVEAWKEYLPDFIPLPHPSWHNNRWIKKHKWFKMELLPELRRRAREILNA